MNKQRKLTRKEKIKLAKQETIKQHNVSHLQNVKYLTQLSANKWVIRNNNLFSKVLMRPLRSVKWVLVGVIVFITFIAFSPALKNDFINFDDPAYVSMNTALAKPIMEGIKYFFSQHYFGNYNPVTMITYALEYHSVGLNPELYHLVNVVIHLLNVMLVFWFIYLLSGKKLEAAAIVSLFFGIHPMHVESVAFVSELKDVLYTFFFIGGLITYYKYLLKTQDTRHKTQDGGLKSEVRSQKSEVRLHYFLTFILFIISVLSKPTAVTFPIVLLLLDFYTKRKFDKYVWIEKVPFFIISFILGIITIKAEQQDYLINKSYTLFQSLLFASYSMLDYIVKLFLPINLSAVYPYPQLIEGHLPYIFYITPFIVLLLFYGIYRTFRYSQSTTMNCGVILFGFLFFFINIGLVLKVLAFGPAIMADRYTYIPYIGLFFIIAMGFSRLIRSQKSEVRSLTTPAIIVIIILAITSSYLTYARCEIWKNSETVWTDVLNKFPNNLMALDNKGTILYKKGQYKEAMELFTEAIQLKPNYSSAYINLANCYHKLHDYDNAIKNINIALKYSPDNYFALNNKGLFLCPQGKYKEAVIFLTKAVQLKPNYIKSYINLADCYKALHDYDNALEIINIGLTYSLDNYEALNNKGLILCAQRKYKQAMELFKEVIKLNSQYVDAYINIGICYGMLRDYDNAIVYWKKALEFNPDNAGIYKMLGMVYQIKGDKGTADAYYAKAKNNE